MPVATLERCEATQNAEELVCDARRGAVNGSRDCQNFTSPPRKIENRVRALTRGVLFTCPQRETHAHPQDACCASIPGAKPLSALISRARRVMGVSSRSRYQMSWPCHGEDIEAKTEMASPHASSAR